MSDVKRSRQTFNRRDYSQYNDEDDEDDEMRGFIVDDDGEEEDVSIF